MLARWPSVGLGVFVAPGFQFPAAEFAGYSSSALPFVRPDVKIRVYRYGENPDKVTCPYHVSKSTAARWCDWGTHIPIGKASIQERYREPFRAVRGRAIPPLVMRYSPDRMPPLELPQLHFEEPQSAAWREIHRKVTFPVRLPG